MTLRWGIVSAGKITNDFANAFNTFPDVGDQVLAAIAARDWSRAKEFATLHKIPKVFDSYEDMAKSNSLDIAYIGALNPDHYNLSKLFLENGKHVLCEKPLWLNLKQTQSLVNIAKQKKRFLMEAVWSRFSPIYLALEKAVQAGEFGEVKHVDVTFGTPIAMIEKNRKKELGGSSILTIGIYALQFAQFIFKDEPVKVTAVGNLNELGVDVTETVVLEYQGGRRAALNVDSTVKLWNKATVVGTKGRITLEDPFHFPEVMIRVDGTVEKIPLHTSNIPFKFMNSAGLVYQTLEVAKCIRKGLFESPRMPHKESLVLAKLEDTVRRQIGVHFDADDEKYP
ncbi:trans-1,2-dihydrobenzene-1,2-diol dehydrogenase-like isoform X3 [Ostrinia furnacalis]|uniref:trans-1,2-dihydrobenzene-1,2-diol dehydrogenase-like isoform X3 n=1 Tax=Ostrinia furnacalis TaxID=93504 RepID=UPI00103F6F6E|nr:trans-1,2-dihydrobenzene-1,2-diol dehydrogenase-like isoform X3 [Ostrinia furnacalis]